MRNPRHCAGDHKIRPRTSWRAPSTPLLDASAADLPGEGIHPPNLQMGGPDTQLLDSLTITLAPSTFCRRGAPCERDTSRPSPSVLLNQSDAQTQQLRANPSSRHVYKCGSGRTSHRRTWHQ